MSSKFTCRFCKEQFDVPKGLYKHLQSVHTAGASRDNRTCPICGVLCLKYEGYRDHLLYIHGQTDEGLKLTFKSLNGNFKFPFLEICVCILVVIL